ncbi:MAG TPA: hypothetical protein VGL72_25515, partial [Bryobacteraceae bacterium]
LAVAPQTVDNRQTIADQVTALANSKLKSGLDVSFANVNLGEAKLLLADPRTRSAPRTQPAGSTVTLRPHRLHLPRRTRIWSGSRS